MEDLFLTSDHHWFHKNIISLCNRPFRSLEEMHRVMQEKWNNSVLPADTVLVLGDWTFGNFAQSRALTENLNGEKILIRGNHDKNFKDHQFLEMGFAGVIPLQGFVVKHFGQTLRFSHFPSRDSNEQKFATHRPVLRENEWLLHGHSHDKSWVDTRKRNVNVGVDVWGFAPVALSKILEVIRESTN